METIEPPPDLHTQPPIVHPDMSFMLWFGIAGVLLCSGILYEVVNRWLNPVYGDEHYE